ncbi:hypothetical protein ACFSKU_16550 [Pontibacter silvestris]|uniref:Rho-binding antiterminator n=1 Tax=Pontibacter silvestris TaxID=2305183 RepID=A0ABW4X2X4_9BACT|nr:hypothetical protein [Pontibacter silvestris]MCC9136083.1 hypothetical protein [Pontibacter silvestris]
MEISYKPIDSSYREMLEELAAKKAFVRVQYFTDLRELLNVTAVMKEVFEKDDAAYLRLATGEEVRLDRIVRVADKPAPGYDEAYFKCDI